MSLCTIQLSRAYKLENSLDLTWPTAATVHHVYYAAIYDAVN